MRGRDRVVAGPLWDGPNLERGGRRFSVRPERIELNGHGEPATGRGRVFVGAFTRILVDTEGRRRLTIVKQNDVSGLEPGARARSAAGRDAYEDSYPRTTRAGGPMTKRMWR